MSVTGNGKKKCQAQQSGADKTRWSRKASVLVVRKHAYSKYAERKDPLQSRGETWDVKALHVGLLIRLTNL